MTPTEAEIEKELKAFKKQWRGSLADKRALLKFMRSFASVIHSHVLSEVMEAIGKNERQKRQYSHEIYHRNQLRSELRTAITKLQKGDL